MSLNHLKVSPKPDGAFPAQVQASDWNAQHDLSTFSWQDLPAGLKAQDLVPGRPQGAYNSNSLTQQVKAVVYYAETDIQVLGVHAYQAITSTTDHLVGVAACTVSEVFGGLVSVTADAILGEAPYNILASVGWVGGPLASPITITAGSHFLAYTRTEVQDRVRIATSGLQQEGLGVRPLIGMAAWASSASFVGSAGVVATPEVAQNFWVLPTYRIL